MVSQGPGRFGDKLAAKIMGHSSLHGIRRTFVASCRGDARGWVWLLALGCVLATHTACEDDAERKVRGDGGVAAASRDGAAGDLGFTDAPDAASDVARIDGAPDPRSGGALLITVSPSSDNAPSNWGGILLYDIALTLGPAIAKDEIDKSLVRDPAGLAFRQASLEVLVGNRHGNMAADGVSGSVSRFIYDPEYRTFKANGTIVGNGLAAVHQVFVSGDGDLFAANRNGGVSRFAFSADGTFLPKGTIGGVE